MVIAIVIVMAGAVALWAMPVAQYPDITPPQVSVSASYPGASAATLANTVGQPIEEQVNGVPGMLYMQSTSSSSGSYALQVTFAIGTNPDIDQVNVQNRLQRGPFQAADRGAAGRAVGAFGVQQLRAGDQPVCAG